MSIPCNVQFKFGRDLDSDGVNADPVISSELKDRLTKLLTGKFNVDADGRCIIDPIGADWPDGLETRDSVCVTADLLLVEVTYCKDV